MGKSTGKFREVFSVWKSGNPENRNHESLFSQICHGVRMFWILETHFCNEGKKIRIISFIFQTLVEVGKFSLLG